MGAKGLEKRGMLHHAVGHGWTCEPFGIPGLEWKAEETEISDDIRIMLASKQQGNCGMVLPLIRTYAIQ